MTASSIARTAPPKGEYVALSAAPSPLPAPTGLGERVYDLLTDEIVSGQIEAGTPLREVSLSERLGVSRTPVREALRRLAEAGLVVTELNRSYRAAPIDLDALSDTAVVYGELCGAAARLASPHLEASDIAWLTDVERTVAARSLDGAPELGERLALSVPDLFLARCGNRVLVETAGRLRVHVLRAVNLYGPQVPLDRRAERLGGIAAAARSGDAELLGAVVRVFSNHTLLDIAAAARAAAEG